MLDKEFWIFLIETKLWIAMIATIVILATLHRWANQRNEGRRPEFYEGAICPRCRQPVVEEELYPVWKVLMLPLNLWMFDFLGELNVRYCLVCSRVLNVFLIIGFILTLSFIGFFVFLIAIGLGFLDVTLPDWP